MYTRLFEGSELKVNRMTQIKGKKKLFSVGAATNESNLERSVLRKWGQRRINQKELFAFHIVTAILSCIAALQLQRHKIFLVDQSVSSLKVTQSLYLQLLLCPLQTVTSCWETLRVVMATPLCTALTGFVSCPALFGPR